jgi:flagellar hook-associated protein 2
MDLGVSGLASGFDWKSFIDQMVDVERAPEKRLFSNQDVLKQQQSAYDALKTQLATVQTRVDALKDPSLFDSRTVSIQDGTVASATASSSTPLGNYSFTFTQLATSAKLNGAGNIGAGLSATTDVSGVILNQAGFATAIKDGTFTVNGKQITVDPAGSLQDVFDAIQTATGGSVTAGYDPATDAISLNSASEIILGSSTDTSNFLQVAKLYNNGTGTTSSSSALGGISRTATLNAGNFATALDDGGAGAGSFKINGVSIAWSATGDSLNNVIDRINSSNAGVVANYDQVNDRVTLTNKTSGDVGISIEDETGNFAASSGLSGGALQHGKNLLFSIDGGPTLVSQSNTIPGELSSLSGLSVTAMTEGTTVVTVGSDSAKIKTAIQDFLTEYNKAQSLIETDTASSTDAQGVVTAGLLTGQSDASDIGSLLRSNAFATIASFASSMNQLDDLGIVTNGTDNNLNLDDETKLDAALANNLSDVKKLFTDADNGIATKLSTYLNSVAGEDGSLAAKSEKLGKDISSIDTQVKDMERIVQANKDTLTQKFLAMEQAQAQINQQLQFLSQRFGTSAASPSIASAGAS